MRQPLRFTAVVALAIVVFGFLTAALLGGLGTLEHRSASERFVAEVGPLEPEKYAPEPVPDVENATRWIQKGADAVTFENEAVGEEGDRFWVEACGTEGPAAVPAERLATVRAALARNEAAFADVEKSVALAKANWNIPYEDGAEAKLPNLLSGVRVAKALACDARLAIADGDAARATRRIEALGRMARAYEAEPLMIVFLVGVAIERHQLVAVRDAVASPTTPPESLVAVEASLSDVPLREQWRRATAADAAAIHRTLGRTGTPGDHSRAGRWERVLQSAVWSVGGKWWMSNHLNRTARVYAEMDKAPVRAQATLPILIAPPPWWAKLFPDMTANVTAGMERAASVETQRRLANRAIGLRLTAAVTGRHPAALDPPSTPDDDPFSGEPFTWTVRADGSATLAAPTTGREAAKVMTATREAWWSFELPSPTPPAGSSSSSPTTPGLPDTPPSPRPPARTPPS